MQLTGITTRLACELASIDMLTDTDVEMLHTLVIDLMAASFAGYKLNSGFNEAVEHVWLDCGGSQESSVLLRSDKYPAHSAAFVNAAYAHGAELDDGNRKAMGHVGVHVIPATFALAESLGSSNEEVLLALAAGYEAYIRVSSAAQPGMVHRGFHSTGMAGTLAAAAACAKLYGLDAGGMEDAIGLATTMAGGLLSYGDSRPVIKPINPGNAAKNGVIAARLAYEGMRGPAEALEGPNGWFHAVTDSVDLSMLEACDHLLLHDCYIKLYPSCRHTHCGIEAASNLHPMIAGREIEAVRVFIYPNAIRLAGQISHPVDANETKFSIKYTLACALANGTYGIEDMDVSRATDEVWSLISKTALIADESMEDRRKGVRGARVEVVLTDGTVLEETVLVPKGDPEKPLSGIDVLNKLKACAGDLLSEESSENLVRSIRAIKGNGRFESPYATIRRAP